MAYRAGNRRRFRPWLPEPGLWFQWDYGDGPPVEGPKTWLWCAWLAWSRFRVVLPIRDKTLPTVIACIDATPNTVRPIGEMAGSFGGITPSCTPRYDSPRSIEGQQYAH